MAGDAREEELPDDGEDDGEEVCRTCGEPYDGYGDGWDGECGNCADRSYVEDEDREETRTLFKDNGGYSVADIDHSADDEAPVGCGSCAWHGRYDQTVAIGLCSLTPGDPSPSGRCPECDSLCYLDAVEEKNKIA
jgi:hypothetical protein